MVVSFGTPLITTLSLSLRQIYLKRSLKSSCRIIYRNYCSNNENVFAYNVIFKDRKVTKDGQDFIPIFSSLLTRNGNQSNSNPQIKLLDIQQWVSQQSRVVDLVNTQSEMTPEFLDGLCTSFKSLSEDELLKVIQCLNQCKKSNSLLHSTLVSKLDKECIRRLPQWNWNTSCQALQVWYNLDLIKLGKFYRRVMSHYSPLIQKMNSQQLVEFSFFLNLNRNFPTQLNTRNFETKLQLSWKNFSPNEMGVVSMAFFKCQKEITNAALLEQLVTAVKGNAKTIDDITLAAMLKLIRRSCTDASKTPTSVLSLFDALIDEIPRLNPKAIIQLVTVAGSINYFHHPTLEKVARRFSTEIGATRLKDLERFALSLSFSGYNSPAVDQFWKQVEMELVKTERQAEISHFPRSLISLLVYFVTLGRFPKDLFRIAFDPENLNKTLGIYFTMLLLPSHLLLIKQMFLGFHLDSSYTSVKREIPFLYHSIRIECPQYEGPAIPLATIKTLEDKQVFNIVEF